MKKWSDIRRDPSVERLQTMSVAEEQKQYIEDLEEKLNNLFESIEALKTHIENGLDSNLIVGILNEFLSRKGN